MTQAKDFYAYRLAATNGHLNIMKFISEQNTNNILENILADDCFAFR